MGVRYPGQADINPDAPEAVGVCDRCGRLWNLRKLQYQVQWAGTQLINTGYLVCPECYDEPSEFLRTIVLPPDPPPLYPTRTENFAVDEKNFYNLKAPIGHPSMFPGGVTGLLAQISDLGKILFPDFTVTSHLTSPLMQGVFEAASMSVASAISGPLAVGLGFSLALAGASVAAATDTAGFLIAPALTVASAMAGPLARAITMSASMTAASAVTAASQQVRSFTSNVAGASSTTAPTSSGTITGTFIAIGGGGGGAPGDTGEAGGGGGGGAS